VSAAAGYKPTELTLWLDDDDDGSCMFLHGSCSGSLELVCWCLGDAGIGWKWNRCS
jgi:hypothetical protein